MPQNRLFKILSRVAEIKPGEELISLFLFLYFFLITAPYNIIKSLRVANYLEKEGANKLPLAYLLTAILTGFVVALHSKLQAKIPKHLLIIASLIFFTLTCFLFWLSFPYNWSWLPLTYWVWANIFAVVLVTQFWASVNEIFNPREAKRLIGFFGSGGILGGIVGGEVTGLLAKPEESYNLLLVASVMLFACVLIIHYVFRSQKERSANVLNTGEKYKEKAAGHSKEGFRACFEAVKGSNYLRLLAGAVTLTLIVSTLIDWQFSSVIEKAEPLKNNLTSFLGHFNAGMLVFSFFVQLLLTSKIIKRWGLGPTMLIYPGIMLVCSLGIAALPGLAFAILIKGSDKSLHYSLDQSVHKLLYIPITPEIKHKAEIFIDMFLDRFAKCLGAVLLMIFFYFKLGITPISLIAAALILAWIFLNLKVSQEYVSTVKQKLRVKWGRADSEVAKKVDMDYAKLVFDTLESKNRSSVLYAMHLFDLIKQDKLTPELKKLISYQADEMKVSSLGSLFEAEELGLVPEVDDTLSEDVLKQEIQEVMDLDVYKEVMNGHIEKVMAEKRSESVQAKMEVAKALGLMEPKSPLIHRLGSLLADDSAEVRKYAIESAGKLKRRDHVLSLIRNLGDPITREDASAALEKYGEKVVGTLGDYLRDQGEDLESRKAVTSVLARIQSREAEDILIRELAANRGDMDTELIDALDKIRSEKPEVLFSEKLVKSVIAREIKHYCQVLIEFVDSKSEKAEKEPGQGPEKCLSDSLMNIFKLLGLIYFHEDMSKAYQNIKTLTKDSADYAIELLDNALDKEMKDMIFPLVEDMPLEQRVKKCRNLLKAFPDL